uniref:G-type lectin S-receptor-like serine/threonine-protein kinase n=1 Tax=Tanacetum cinerariifolium TaxID=118510 RepID=A0A6L2LG61_TANCI|nr:G-type lectin S-receptor-like serine/threonine-protein kinase [Tanacetum cinerariifolium]
MEEDLLLTIIFLSFGALGLETHDSGSSKRKPIIIVAVSILVGLILVGLTFAFYARSKKRTSYMKRQGSVCEGQKEEADIPSFSLSKISKSTNNFSITNKLGEGGFGPVYKAWRLYKEDRSLELVSSQLKDTCIDTELIRSIHIGLLCVQNHAEDRPTMSSVVVMLDNESTLPPPKQPAFFTGISLPQTNAHSSTLNHNSVADGTITLLDGR